ncbi:uncharacterized protein LOC135167948 [Diachasmimorpha longicaudata]|uniref:uncharacterized protein LOC135167948 n=1 Tax=Diachasmimorpha longicaudata TaxID=58733 RepID=UPI0030B90C0E
MAVIGIGAENSNDEVTQYQMGRYVSTVHLENGQRVVYFTAQNAVQRAAQPPSTTLTSFVETCQNDDFAQTLLYSEMPKYYTWNQSSRRFIRRKQGKPVPGYTDVYSTDAIGRIYSSMYVAQHHSNSYELLMVNCVDPTEKPVNVCNCLKMTLIGIKLSMMLPDRPNRPMHDAFNQELHREKLYDLNALKELIQTNLPLLNEQQKYVFETLMKVTNDETGGIYFLDASGGTGKTFLISLILATIRTQNKIALALASSGIAATLLEGGRTAHSALKLPLNMQSNETPTCNVSKNSAMAKVLQQCKLIVWDECTMAHKKSLEALDRTLKDLRSNNNRFGGAMILLSGDFRQTLPVIPRSTPADELNACLKSSNLWKHVKVLHLSKNMRVELQNDQSGNIFSKQRIDIGNGKFPIDMLTGCINFPQSFCQLTRSKDELIQKVFPDVSQNYRNHDWLSERAILAAKNIDVNELNFKIQEQITGDLRIYKSVDSTTNQDDVLNYPPEFLNSLDLPGLPPHNLQLKKTHVSHMVNCMLPVHVLENHQICLSLRQVIKQKTSCTTKHYNDNNNNYDSHD